jgi:hypothetical protein
MQTVIDKGMNVDQSGTLPEYTTPAIAYRPRPRKDMQAKRPGRQSKAPTKRPVKLMIPEGLYEVAIIHSLRRGESLSDLISGLIQTHLNEFVVHRKAGVGSQAEAG